MATRAELEKSYDRLFERWIAEMDAATDLYLRWTDVSPDSSAAYEAAKQLHADAERKANETRAEFRAIQDQMRDMPFEVTPVMFKRSKSGLSGLLTRRLGPVPENTPAIDMSPKNTGRVKSFRLQGIALGLASIALAVTTMVYLPWLRFGLFTGMYLGAASIDGSEVTVTITGTIINFVVLALLAFAMFYLRRNRPNKDMGIFDAAIGTEEQHYRAGAQAWTLKQRFYSCVAFGLHQALVIVLPLAFSISFALVGAVLMAVYLREFKRSGSQEQATIASAKLNLSFSWTFLAVLYAAATVNLIFSVIAL